MYMYNQADQNHALETFSSTAHAGTYLSNQPVERLSCPHRRILAKLIRIQVYSVARACMHGLKLTYRVRFSFLFLFYR